MTMCGSIFLIILCPKGSGLGVLSRHGEPLINMKATPEKSAYYPIKNLLESAAILASIGDS
jgi:N-acylglucosamine 2-epimerase